MTEKNPGFPFHTGWSTESNTVQTQGDPIDFEYRPVLSAHCRLPPEKSEASYPFGMGRVVQEPSKMTSNRLDIIANERINILLCNGK